MGRAEELYERLIVGGESTIDALLQERTSEELFLDFKRSADNGAGSKLHQNDRNNLGRAISGFGNSEGGVIVWGVECKDVAAKGDVASAKVYVRDPKRFVSWLTGAISGCTVPAHPTVQHHAIAGPTPDEGFAVTLVAKSYLAPHQCLSPLQYYMRAGSDFVPVPHAVLQGMFGRRPTADILHMWACGSLQLMPVAGPTEALSFRAGFLLSTNGPGLVRDIFVTGQLGSPGGKSEVQCGFQDATHWSGNKGLGRFSLVSADGYKLAPGAIIQPFFLDLRLQPPFREPLQLSLNYGHRDSPTLRSEHFLTPTELQAAFDLYTAARTSQAAMVLMERVTGGRTVPAS